MNNLTDNPSLTEPGVKYFLKETLLQCRDKQYKLNSQLFNIFLFLFFIGVFGGILYYKYRSKPTDEDLKMKNLQKQQWILSKVKENMDQKNKTNIITDLPPMESPFELLHKKYYSI
tara:strand:+ start:90 stop:437 length:348 start_codon:yes stop_codon:yes gene_type:complete